MALNAAQRAELEALGPSMVVVAARPLLVEQGAQHLAEFFISALVLRYLVERGEGLLGEKEAVAIAQHDLLRHWLSLPDRR